MYGSVPSALLPPERTLLFFQICRKKFKMHKANVAIQRMTYRRKSVAAVCKYIIIMTTNQGPTLLGLVIPDSNCH